MPTPYWEPGTPYNYGDIVEYHGHRYKIIQPHTSQSDWAPGPATEALWGRIIEDDDDRGEGYQQSKQQPYQQPPHYDQEPEDQKSEEKKHWYGDDSTKKKLEIGAGLLAGAALLGGGMLAYKKHEEHKKHEDHRETKAEGWVQGDWINEAQQRTEAYHKNGTQEPCVWVLNKGKEMPKGAILVGREHSWNLYICRAFVDGGIHPGKASDAFQKGGVIGWGNEEIQVDVFEVLIGDMNRLHWVTASGRLDVASLGYRPVQGGQENDGTPLYVAEAHHQGAVHPGKISERFDGASIPYGGKEVQIREYRVLCYNN